MEQIILKARAKINWTLDVLNKRPDGYHNVDMLMQSIDLADRVRLCRTSGAIQLKSTNPHIPRDRRNIAFRAVELVKEYTGITEGVDIFIEKNIPIAAGLAGGSTDGAAVLIGLNRLWKLGWTTDEFIRIGMKLGGDVPFCLFGGSARAQGIGEQLTFLNVDKFFWLVLVKPYGRVSTKAVYSRLDLEKIAMRPRLSHVLHGLTNGNASIIASGLGNVLETVSLSMKPEISRIKTAILETGALGSLMSGSGPSVYGIYASRERAQRGYEALKRRYKECFLVPTAKESITEIK